MCATTFRLNQRCARVHAGKKLARCVRRSVCLSLVHVALCEGMRLSVCVCVCLVRMMWHGGHFCQIQHPGPCCDVKGTVKRQPQGSTGTAAPSALFPSVAHTHTHTQAHRRAHTGEHTRPSCKLTHSGGKAPLGRKSPGIVQSLQNKCYRLLVDCLLLVSSCVMLHVTGKTGALTHLRLNWEDSGSYRSCLEPGAELWKRKG